MGREIKFRAWDQARKKMFTPYQIAFQKKEGLVIRELVKGDLIKRPKSILLQYTCYKDKDDKEIYEGFILKEDNGNIWEIVWYKTGLQMKAIDSGEIYFTLKESCELKILKIIGHKYENPELIS